MNLKVQTFFWWSECRVKLFAVYYRQGNMPGGLPY